jgi:hypothetical protein
MDFASEPQPRPVFCWHGLAVVCHKGAGDGVYCRNCDREWANRDAYFADADTLNEQYQAHLAKHTIQPEGTEL